MQIATWNVNSIRARLERVLAWLDSNRPDVLCMQETKVTDEQFPHEAFTAQGYHAVVHGQKSYNGVAILARDPPQDPSQGFDDGEDEVGARLLAATVRGVRIHSVYVPNGQVVGSEAYELKLRWLARLRAMLERHHRPEELLVVCGDFNVAPEPRDVYDPEFWRTQVLFHSTARAALADLCGFGLVDTFRLHHEEGGLYSWWDYRQLAFPKNLGVRIDLVLASRGLAAHCTAASIDRRARGGASASDHAPALATFGL
jgi:exodeoxyribonuclease-3